MDAFDEIYKKQMSNETQKSENNDLKTKKRGEIHTFFSNRLSLIFLLLLIVAFIFTVFDQVISLITPSDVGVGSKVFSFILSIVLAVFIPLGFYRIFKGSKTNDDVKFNNGIDLLLTYVKIVRILLIIASAGLGIFIILAIFTAPIALLFGIIAGLIMWLGFYILKLFNDYFDGIKSSYNGGYNLMPSASKIITYLVVVLVIAVISAIIFIALYSDPSAWLPAGMPLNYQGIQSYIQSNIVLTIIGLFIGLATLGYYLYYAKAYEKTFMEYNNIHSKLVEEDKRTRTEKEA